MWSADNSNCARVCSNASHTGSIPHSWCSWSPSIATSTFYCPPFNRSHGLWVFLGCLGDTITCGLELNGKSEKSWQQQQTMKCSWKLQGKWSCWWRLWVVVKKWNANGAHFWTAFDQQHSWHSSTPINTLQIIRWRLLGMDPVWVSEHQCNSGGVLRRHSFSYYTFQ